MILDKAKMAHDYAIEMLKRGDPERSIAFDAWTLADAMQAEADKRMVKLPDVFFDTKPNEEWQPDWSQAPDWANWWCLSVMHGAMWFSREPICTKATWVMLNDVKFCAASFDEAPSFNYQGNWQDSLRKRPQ